MPYFQSGYGLSDDDSKFNSGWVMLPNLSLSGRVKFHHMTAIIKRVFSFYSCEEFTLYNHSSINLTNLVNKYLVNNGCCPQGSFYKNYRTRRHVYSFKLWKKKKLPIQRLKTWLPKNLGTCSKKNCFKHIENVPRC